MPHDIFLQKPNKLKEKKNKLAGFNNWLYINWSYWFGYVCVQCFHHPLTYLYNALSWLDAKSMNSCNKLRLHFLLNLAKRYRCYLTTSSL